MSSEGEVIVHKGRTCTLYVSLGFDVSADTITSQVRTQPDQSSTLIMTWVVDYVTDGTDGELVLTVDNTATASIKENSGFMDLKRVTGGEPVPLFDGPIEVQFRGTVTE